jgi:hypothetical protein
MVVVQMLSDRDIANRSTVAERLIGILFDDDRMKNTSNYLAVTACKPMWQNFRAHQTIISNP